jgi:phosphatidylglycerophosphate synthase
MEYGQQIRARMLQPALVTLTASRVSPDHLTAMSLMFGLAFAPSWYLQSYTVAIICLWLHVILDGLDGPLARHQQCESPRGSFTDSFCDQIVVSVVTIMMMISPPRISVVAGSLYLVVYTGVLAIAMVRNSLQIPYSWLVRPRLFVFVAIPLQLAGIPHLINSVIWISNALLAWKLATGFYRLRRRLDGPQTESTPPSSQQ